MSAQSDVKSARIRATEAKRLLLGKLKIAIKEASSDQDRLTKDYLEAIQLEVESLRKEVADVLKPKDGQASQRLTDAVTALKAEIESIRQEKDRWVALGHVVRIAQAGVDGFEIA